MCYVTFFQHNIDMSGQKMYYDTKRDTIITHETTSANQPRRDLIHSSGYPETDSAARF